ncbi:MAG TPA: ribonuclease R [Bacteroidales bacterium]|mgnify:CR=1 FL=1|nr:ribonuclease R [Bacteroidales bacterium]
MEKQNKSEGGLNKKTLSSEVLNIFSRSPKKELNYKQIASMLNINKSNDRTLIVKILDELKVSGNLKEISKGKFKLSSKTGFVVGEIDMNKAGHAFVISSDISDDIYVPFNNLNSAMHGDTVKVSLYACRKGGRMEGEVIEVIKRANNQFVGTIECSGSYGFLIPDNPKMVYDIFVPSDGFNGANDGEKVIVEITEWPRKSKNPKGIVVEVLGKSGDNEVEMHAILAEFGLPYRFPEVIEKETLKISDKITQYDYEIREDFRNISTFTIDPEDAKDFDDALSFLKLENGNYQIGVHIADVTNYITENSELDIEAYNRATSVYLVDRVVPMLPEKLSNFLCSLRPGEDKLCFSVIFEMNTKAEMIDYRIVKTIINSDKRFSYEEAQNTMDNKKGDFLYELSSLNELAKILREKRFRKGAFNFEHFEVKFKLDANAIPTGVYFKESIESNFLIEEFMLLANKTVAEEMGKIQKIKDFVYRIHPKPNEDKLNSFSGFIKRFGYEIDISDNIKLARSMNKLISEVMGKPEQNVIENLAVRAMSKAIYTTKNIGHYGLAFDYYTHFTSPIRRYPDMLVHRILFDSIRGKRYDNTSLEEKTKHCSYMEQQASLAERASIKYKQAEFMKNKIGQVFEGVISGVTEWGFFVQLKENACEGLVHMRTLNDDFYTYDAENYCITGTYTNKCYQLGSIVSVKLINVNLQKKQIDFELSYLEVK